ncbi:Aromatic hydrocarbon utilization transcriptional regulator CatR [Arthrobacter crystallopoietes BAB-32]|uniref:Aromatic hydrocarbon utilization transcriptional regulator CatR n=1 Tax=Arthrobacter crystallopoietes BAB-32 TaxID=1246476 RepID=N1UXU0_9MICC|nr:LysR family transcriptional regulator [Arthrobacter crystallopoietes]EMY32604.1 Aromatic hydrocarbon utilization transcriptional regulator CatR [Arthrobacter crystallopoietes BAB-32]
MDVELRYLRSFVGVVEAGSFTDAAIDLGISQAAVSRHVAALERALDVRLLHRTTRSVEPTQAGERVVRRARQMLILLTELRQEVHDGGSTVRVGYAWSALGKHTPAFQREWASALPHSELRLIRSNTPTAGLAEGISDLAILRRIPDNRSLELVAIGVEKRYCAMASSDPLAGKRSVTLAQVASSPVALDLRTGSTRLDLWPDDRQPERTISIEDVDDWLTVIGSGRARGITAESTAHQYRRPGLVYRPVRDAPPVQVYAAWSRLDPPAARREVVELLARIYA